MRAVVVKDPGIDPVVTDYVEPAETDAVARVVAAPLNPVDRIIARGQIGFRRLVPPAVAGLEGVAQTPDGQLRYFFAPQVPYGSYAELVPLSGAETVVLPEGLDPVRAAALGVPGMAAWMALVNTAHVQHGESVLVLGGTGAVGTLAVQIARALGAGTVVGTARNTAGFATVERLGGVPASVADMDEFDATLATLSPDGFDVVIDLLWGQPFAVAATHLARGARIAQVGNSAGATSPISAPTFRNTGSSIIGHSNFLVTPQERLAAFSQVATLAAAGDIDVAADPIGFADFDQAWRGEGPAKPVLVP